MVMDLKSINSRQKVISPLGEVLRAARGSYSVNAGVSMIDWAIGRGKSIIGNMLPSIDGV